MGKRRVGKRERCRQLAKQAEAYATAAEEAGRYSEATDWWEVACFLRDVGDHHHMWAVQASLLSHQSPN